MKITHSIILVLIFLGSCASLNTNVSIKKTFELPITYASKLDSSNAADLKFSQLFSDTHLVKLIDTALKNNFDLKIANQRIQLANANLLMSKGRLFPFITANAGAGLTKFGRYTADAVGNYDVQFSQNITKDEIVPKHLPNFYGTLQTSWEADIWGRLNNAKKSAYYKMLTSVEGKNFTVSSLVALVSNAYYELLALDYELDIIRQTITLQNNQLDIIKLEKDAGRANELAVQQFEAQVLNYRTLETEILQKIIENENEINFLLARLPQPIFRNKQIYIQGNPLDIQIGIPSNLLENRPDVRAASMQVMASKASLQSAKKAFYPRLNITGALGYQSFNPKFIISPQSVAYSILGGLAAPLINKSAIRAEFNISKAEQTEALYNYQKTILNGYIEVNNQLASLANLKQAYTYKSKEVETLNKAIETVSELYLRGRANYLEILITRKTALQSSLELIEIKKRQYETTVSIYKALGGGWR